MPLSCSFFVALLWFLGAAEGGTPSILRLAPPTAFFFLLHLNINAVTADGFAGRIHSIRRAGVAGVGVREKSVQKYGQIVY